jgi:hypothetical protein
MQLKSLSPVLLTNATSKVVNGETYLKAEALKDLTKNALVYKNLKLNKELFDEFYKKLLWWFEEEQTKGQLKAIGTWLEKKVLCGGEPEIVHGEVVNYEEEKNLLNLLNAEDIFVPPEGIEKRKIKLVGKAKRFIGLRKVLKENETIEGTFEVDFQKVENYEKHAQKPELYPLFKENRITEVINEFSLKVLESDKELFADRGYSDIVKILEDIEAESQNRLVRLNYKGGVLPYGAELFCYEQIEKGKGRKEYHHLSEIFRQITDLGFAGEIFKGTREITVDRKPLGWLFFLS